jgi:large repetitive protein
VSFGGSAATNVTVVNAASITATTPPHATVTVSVAVTNPNGQSATLVNGYTYRKRK